MVFIIIVSLLAWGLIIERLVFFHRLGKIGADTKDIQVELNKHHLPSVMATNLCTPMLRAFVLHIRGETKLDRHILDHYALLQRNRLWYSLEVLTALAAAAPLLGLFGTVNGMIDTFDVITSFGTANAKALAAGISEALITTQSGLLVGIPGLFMARLIQQHASKLDNRLDETILAVQRCL